MDNKAIFNTAHSKTRAIVAKNPALKYRVVFSFQLKKAIAEQPKKVTTLHANGLVLVELVNKKEDAKTAKKAYKKVNKKVAMIGDYKKPTYIRNGYKVSKQINPSLSVTYNLDTLFSLIVSAICVITIYYLALQAIAS